MSGDGPIIVSHGLFVCLFICLFVCLFVFLSTREFLTHMETSPLPVKGCKFGPMLSTHGHWAVRVSHGSHGIIRIPFRVYHFMKFYENLMNVINEYICSYLEGCHRDILSYNQIVFRNIGQLRLLTITVIRTIVMTTCLEIETRSSTFIITMEQGL